MNFKEVDIIPLCSTGWGFRVHLSHRFWNWSFLQGKNHSESSFVLHRRSSGGWWKCTYFQTTVSCLTMSMVPQNSSSVHSFVIYIHLFVCVSLRRRNWMRVKRRWVHHMHKWSNQCFIKLYNEICFIWF